jgi:glycosyltransferase involved in cell wall biosynthesis
LSLSAASDERRHNAERPKRSGAGVSHALSFQCRRACDVKTFERVLPGVENECGRPLLRRALDIPGHATGRPTKVTSALIVSRSRRVRSGEHYYDVMVFGSNDRKSDEIWTRQVAVAAPPVKSTPDILIAGPYPPPRGGVSTHIARSASLLIRQGLAVEVLSHYEPRPDVPFVLDGARQNPLRYFSRIRASDARLVHYHHSTWSSLVATALGLVMRSECTRVITVHSPTIARDLQRRPRRLARWSLGQFDKVIAVTVEIADLLRPVLPDHTICVIPAFVPQAEGDELPPALASFVEAKDVFVAAAWRLKFLPNGDDLYGFDVLARAFLGIAPRAPSARLVLLVGEEPGRRGRRYLRSLQALLEEGGLHGRYMIERGVDLASVLARDVTLVRPTRSDGDAVSIREALRNGRQVIATDVAARPAGVRVIPAGDSAALVTAMEESMSSGRPSPATAAPPEREELPEDFARLLSVYRRYLGQT